MTGIDWSSQHSASCRLCDAFAQGQVIRGSDVEELAGPTPATCPYHNVHTHTLRAVIEVEPEWYRQQMDWLPRSDRSGHYVLEVDRYMDPESWDVYTVPGTKTIPGIEQRAEIGKTNDSPESWAFIKRCRDMCRREHPECQTDHDKHFLPPRLLRVDPRGIVLVETRDMPSNSSYVALSYCWGLSQSLCTTKATIGRYKNLIASDILPAVIKDAVVVTQALSEQYIWIDRLCIQQDDADDWTTHAGIMDSIYENADITIAAVSSSNVDEPFLGATSIELRRERPSIEVPWVNDSADLTEQVRIRVWSKYGLIHIPGGIGEREAPTRTGEPRAHIPLDSRGWTFQERFLAKRSIRYEPNQIVFECKTAQYMEKFPRDPLALPDWKATKPKIEVGDWQRAIRSYTERTLTYTEDRPAAISGLASRYQRLLNLPYMAGLWRNDFIISQIRWTINTDPLTIKDWCPWYTGFGDGKAVPGSPTWSWLSINLPIQWTTMDIPDNRFTDIQIIEINVHPSTKNQFGPVQCPASITIRAKLVDGQLTCQEQDRRNTESPAKYKCEFRHNGKEISQNVDPDCYLVKLSMPDHVVSSNRAFRWCRFDPSQQSAEFPYSGDTAPVKILHLEPTSREGEPYTRDHSFALVVTSLGVGVDGQERLERIGTVYINDKDLELQALLKGSKPTTFQLV
ncbi:heterokaryon incompatibility protein-domain-containing protein [Xylariaceae sp. FL0255]|nr:heterokaryon incompatibility protein-domain-containing protein [Xylariaceae sp. FL0255]